MENKQKLALVIFDDWKAIYIDGLKFTKNRTIYTYSWLHLAKTGPYEVSIYSIDDEDFLEDVWGWDFPEKLEESQIKEYKID